MDLSSQNIDDIKTCTNDNVGMQSAYLYFQMIFGIFNIFINIDENANYANMIICIFDHGMKVIYLSFHLVPILVVYGKKQLIYN